MVLPAKIFEIREELSFIQMGGRLRDFREEEAYEGEDDFTLITEILDYEEEEDMILGIFSRDFVKIRHYKRKIIETPVTEEAPFWIKPFEGRMFLIVVAPSVARGVKKLLTNHVANALSEAIFGTTGAIVETRIPDEILQRLHESNPKATRLIWFDDVDIPSVDKLCLSGQNLVDTGLYKDYLEHGRIWYVVFEVQKRGITVGITRNCVVTLFSKSTVDAFIQYVTEDVLTLVE
ncbi:MAG: hypothetical protein PVH79_04840 [Candidatus Bathyarchaeota archaeon]|jgi:hypothetical protein